MGRPQRSGAALGALLCAALCASVAFANNGRGNGSNPWDEGDLRIDQIRELHFGTIAPDRQSPGIVRVKPSRSNFSQCRAPLTCLEGGNRAEFRLSGGDDRFVELILPDRAILRNPHGAQMVVEDFKMHARGFVQGRGRMKRDSSIILGLGADLTVGANQAEGHYQGTFQLILSYE